MMFCHILIKPARIIALYLTVILLGAMGCLWSVPLLITIKLLASIPLLWIAYRIYQHYWVSNNPLKLTYIRITTHDPDRTIWECYNTDNQKTRYHCHVRAYVSPSWLLVRLIPDQASVSKRVKCPYLILHKSQICAEHWRDLHLCVRFFSDKKQVSNV